MKTFKVELISTAHVFATVMVEAENQAQAEVAALDKVQKFEVNWEIDIVEHEGVEIEACKEEVATRD